MKGNSINKMRINFNNATQYRISIELYQFLRSQQKSAISALDELDDTTLAEEWLA
jgi:hypothetical protein